MQRNRGALKSVRPSLGLIALIVPGLHSARASADYKAVYLFPANESGFPDSSQTAAGGQTIGTGNGTAVPPGGNGHALLYTASAQPYIDLNPTVLPGIITSGANATDGTHQIGFVNGPGTNYRNHAVVWTGTANSVVDINPTNINGFFASVGTAISGTQVVGYGNGFGLEHALVWDGLTNSAVDVNPSGFTFSHALGTDGTHQVGYGLKGNNTIGLSTHALLWSGTADSAIDLNPTNLAGVTESYAYSTSGGQQVGYGRYGDSPARALLWTGSGDTAIDLSPTLLAGFTQTRALGTNGTNQVGIAAGPAAGYGSHAMLWGGTGDSAVDLNSFLPADTMSSYAYNISPEGVVSGLAANLQGTYAVQWIPTPEPSAVSLFAVGTVGLLRRRKR